MHYNAKQDAVHTSLGVKAFKICSTLAQKAKFAPVACVKAIKMKFSFMPACNALATEEDLFVTLQPR